MIRKGILLILSASICAFANANIASDWVKVTEIRAMTSGHVFFVSDQVALCNTNVLKIVANTAESKAAYSTLLAAATAGKQVKLETWGECAPNGGWGTEIEAVNVRYQ